MAKLIEDLDGNVKRFAEACYDTNSLSELINAQSVSSEITYDCNEWSLTVNERNEAIQAAINEIRLEAAPWD